MVWCFPTSRYEARIADGERLQREFREAFDRCLAIQMMIRSSCRLPGLSLSWLICDNIPLMIWLPGNHKTVLDDQLLDAVGTYGKPETYSATVGYLARLRPGVSLSLGFNYTANPSQAFYFGPSKANPSQRFEGNALNFQATLFTTF